MMAPAPNFPAKEVFHVSMFTYLRAAILGAMLSVECAHAVAAPPADPITDGPSIQKAVDSAPGQIVILPPGDYEISAAIVISKSGGGLVGPGRIIQVMPDQPILIASHADDVQIRNLVLTRKAGSEGTTSGLIANSIRNLVIDNVQVLDNRSASSSINIDKCVNGRLTYSLVRNYSRVSIDDRLASPNYGFAFKCFDGTGIQLTGCRGMLLQGNRVEELNNLPTKEIKAQFGLGKFIKKNATKGTLTSQEVWDKEEYPTWHQGSAIFVGGPKDSDQTQLIGNYIENAAQGLDIQSDHVVVSQNIVNNAAVGMKAMHGSRNILILGNQFNRCNAHAILLQPGAASHAAGGAVPSNDLPSGTAANIDGASIIANNIVSDFGYGDSNWIWGNERDVICLEPGQLPQNPALTDVIVNGNIVYDPGRDGMVVDGKATKAPPRYRYALLISGSSPSAKGPVRTRIYNNIFDPGSSGVSNARVRSQ